MEKTTIQPNGDTISTESDDHFEDELIVALDLFNEYMHNMSYCWKGAEENLVDPAYEKRLTFEELLDNLSRRLPDTVANEMFRVVRSFELMMFRLFKKGSEGRKLRNDVIFICLLTIVWGILLLFAPDMISAESGLLFDFMTTGFLPPGRDVLDILFLGINWILLLGIACYIVVRIIIRTFRMGRGARMCQIPPECVVERNFSEESGVRVKINLDQMMTIDELFRVHKVNLKILKEKAKLLGFTLEKPNV